MTKHCSHVTHGEIGRSREARIDEVLEPFGAYIVCLSGRAAAGSNRVWIESPRRGHPFDSRREAAMTDALREAGLWPLIRLWRAVDPVTGWHGPSRQKRALAAADAAEHNKGCKAQGGYGSARVSLDVDGRAYTEDGRAIYPDGDRTGGAITFD